MYLFRYLMFSLKLDFQILLYLHCTVRHVKDAGGKEDDCKTKAEAESKDDDEDKGEGKGTF